MPLVRAPCMLLLLPLLLLLRLLLLLLLLLLPLRCSAAAEGGVSTARGVSGTEAQIPTRPVTSRTRITNGSSQSDSIMTQI